MIQPDTRRWGRYTHNSQVILGLDRKKEYLAVFDFPGGSDSKVSAYNAGDPGSIPGWGRSSPVLLPGKSHGRSLVGYSPRGRKESDTTQRCHYKGFPGGASGKEPPSSNAGEAGSIPGSGRPPGGGHGSSPQYSCLQNPMDKGTWWVQSMGSHRVERTLLR